MTHANEETGTPDATPAEVLPPGPATFVVSLPSPDSVASARRYADASRAASTRDKYNRAWDAFDTWCGDQGLAALPAHPGTIAVYLAQRAEAGLSPSALTVALAAIGWVHRQSGRQPPQKAEGGVAIADVMAGIRRA
ncbi:MAG: hypothetical protein ACRYHQ_41240, partial [Janthinobacterium lividum]